MANDQLAPHRGVMILTFGILGFFLCPIFAILAWVMGNGDLREIDAGRMDPAGRDMTNTGKILGIVEVCLFGVAIAVYAAIVMFAGVLFVR